MSDTADLINVDRLHLVSAHAHEFSTMLSVFRYVEQDQSANNRRGKKNISVDLGLYIPAKQLVCQG